MASTMKALGLERDGKIVAGVLYENWNGVNVWCHLAIAPGTYLGRQYLWYIFHYPFVECGMQRITVWVDQTNAESLRLVEHMGFRGEAALKGAARDGGDALLLVMWRGECRFLRPGDPSMAHLEQVNTKEPRHGQEIEQRAAA